MDVVGGNRATTRRGRRRISRRVSLLYLAASASFGLLTACGGANVSTAPPTPAQPAATLATIVAPTPAPSATKPLATVTRPEPKGRLVYGWHTTISPAWLDPQENPPQITPFNFQ